MASIDLSLSSAHNDQKWVAEINEILNHRLEIKIETTPPPSIFKIPESMTTQAYEPQQIGIGPIHHFRPIPYKKMEQEKLAAVQCVVQYYYKAHRLPRNYKEYFDIHILDEVQKLVPHVRASYDMFLQEDNVVLGWVFAIDGLFLLDLFYTYQEKEDYLQKKKQLPREQPYDPGSKIYTSISGEPDVSDDDSADSVEPTSGSQRHELDPKKRFSAKDIMMVENQIPFIILKEIHKTLNPSSGNQSDQIISDSIFRPFCENHSPLQLCVPSKAPAHVQHLLDYMYYSIINNSHAQPRVLITHNMATFGNIETSSNRVDLPSVISIFTQIQKIKDEIVQLYELTISALETFTENVNAIPSASVLHNKVGFNFKKIADNEGIQKIVIKDKKFFLPSITLKNDSEVILMNLVAYEMLVTNYSRDYCPLIEYVRLMCELIVNVKDVKLLKEKDIIKGDLSEDDVVKLFIGMSSVVKNMKAKEKYDYLRKKRVEVKKVYESRLIMKAKFLLKKPAYWFLAILKASRGIAESSWKIVVFVIGILTVISLVTQLIVTIIVAIKYKSIYKIKWMK